MLRFARRAAFFGFRMAVAGVAMAMFAVGTAYQMVSDRPKPSEDDSE